MCLSKEANNVVMKEKSAKETSSLYVFFMYIIKTNAHSLGVKKT